MLRDLVLSGYRNEICLTWKHVNLKSCHLLELQTHIHTHLAKLKSSFHKMVMKVVGTTALVAVMTW